MRWAGMIGLLAVFFVLTVSCGEDESELPMSWDVYPEMVDREGKPLIRTDGRPYNLILTTEVGRLTFNLHALEAPIAVGSFVFLALEGFYDGTVIYRVVPGALAEGGDPTGTGTGGSGYTFEVEPPHRAYARGDLLLANDGSPNSNGSRFYILFGDLAGNAEFPGEYTIVGQLKEGHKPSERTLAALEAVAVPQEELTIMEASVSIGCPDSSSGFYSGRC